MDILPPRLRRQDDSDKVIATTEINSMYYITFIDVLKIINITYEIALLEYTHIKMTVIHSALYQISNGDCVMRLQQKGIIILETCTP